MIGIAGNKLLGDLLDRLRRQSLRVSIILSLPLALYEEAIGLRRQMLDAVAVKDPDRAEDAMRRLNQLTWAALVERGLPADHPAASEVATMRRPESSPEPGA
jgi:DNA-binding GntR family transcriptional regulator